MSTTALIFNIKGKDSTHGIADETLVTGAWDPATIGLTGVNSNYFPALYSEDFTPGGTTGLFLGHWPDGAGGKISAIKVNAGFIGGMTIESQKMYGGNVAGEFTGIQAGSGATKAFFAGADDKDGLNSLAHIQADGDAFFNNVLARGNIAASSMVFNEISATKGSMLITKSAGELWQAIALAASGSASIQIKMPPSGVKPFILADKCFIQNANDSGWFLVDDTGTIVGEYVKYSITWLSSTSTNTLPEGTAIADYGVSSDGGLLLTADRSDAPYMDIFTHTGTPETSTTLRGRFGRLDGITDANFGGALTGFGLYSDSVYLTGNITLASGIFKTNVSGQRVEIDGVANTLVFYNPSDIAVVTIDDDIEGTGSAGLLLSGDDTIILLAVNNGFIKMEGDNTSGATIFQQESASRNPHTVEVESLIGRPSGTGIEYAIRGNWITWNDDTNTGGMRAGLYGSSSVDPIQGPLSTIDTVGVYGTATNDGLGKAFAGYFEDGDVYIENSLGIKTDSPSDFLHVVTTSSNKGITLDGAAGINRALSFDTADSVRWRMYNNSTAEGGSNAGSNLSIARYSDAGSFLGVALFVERSTGHMGVNESSPDGNFHVSSLTDVLAIFEADTDNSGEDDNPRLELRQDGGLTVSAIGLSGVANSIYTNTNINSLYAVVENTDGSLHFGTDSTIRTTIDENGLFEFISGGLHTAGISVKENATPTTLNSAAKVQITDFNTNDASRGATPDHTNDHITIAISGLYEIGGSFVVRNDAAQTHDIEIAAWINNGTTEINNTHNHRTLSGGATTAGSISMGPGNYYLTAGDTVEAWATTNAAANRDVIFEDLVLTVTQKGGPA